jgi:hypothetical protein
MYSSFMSACLMGVALSLKMRSGLEIDVEEHLMPTNVTPAAGPTFALVQTGEDATFSSKVCQQAATRNKAPLPEFYSILNGSSDFADDTFPHTSSEVFAWSDADESYRYKRHISKITWKRAKDVYKSEGYTLFGENGISPQDMRQGSIGNCWFVSAASALSEVSGRLEKVFLNEDMSTTGIYAL